MIYYCVYVHMYEVRLEVAVHVLLLLIDLRIDGSYVFRLRLKFALTGSSDLDLSKFVKSSVVSVTV